jgi:hypothetical protein
MLPKHPLRSPFTIYLAIDLEYITKQEFEELLESVTEISRLFYGFIYSLSPKSAIKFSILKIKICR